MEWAALPSILADVGPAATVGLMVVVAMARGWLVASPWVSRLLDLKDQVIAFERSRGDEWKATAMAERAAREELTTQVATLLEGQELQTNLLRSLQAAAKHRRP